MMGRGQSGGNTLIEVVGKLRALLQHLINATIPCYHQHVDVPTCRGALQVYVAI